VSRTRSAGEKTSTGGLALNTLKKLNGLKFTSPLELIVLAQAMGRGPIEDCNRFCTAGTDNSAGLYVIMKQKYCFNKQDSIKNLHV
jgi:hypothetical protein